MFDDFVAAAFIEQDRVEDSDGRVLFRLTADGRSRAAVNLLRQPRRLLQRNSDLRRALMRARGSNKKDEGSYALLVRE